MNHVVDHGTVVIRTGPGPELTAAVADAGVAVGLLRTVPDEVSGRRFVAVGPTRPVPVIS